MITLIGVCDYENAIAKDDIIPWSIPEDLKWFKAKTFGHTVVMGRKTFESIGKPLIGRVNIVLSTKFSYKVEGCICLNSLEDVLTQHNENDEMFIIGGEQIYRLFLPIVGKIYLTRIEYRFGGNKFFPILLDDEWEVTKKLKGLKNAENPYDYWHIEFVKK